MSTRQQEQDDEDAAERDLLAYEENWYRVLKALSLGEAIELGVALDPELADLMLDPEVIHRVG